MARAGPGWQEATYSSLSPSIQRAYDAYREAFAAAIELGKKLKALADDDWMKMHPEGINGRYCAFNATNGILQWAWVEKKPKNHRSGGADVPSVRQTTSAVSKQKTPQEILAEAKANAKKPAETPKLIAVEQPRTDPAGKPFTFDTKPLKFHLTAQERGRYFYDDLIKDFRGYEGIWHVGVQRDVKRWCSLRDAELMKKIIPTHRPITPEEWEKMSGDDRIREHRRQWVDERKKRLSEADRQRRPGS